MTQRLAWAKVAPGAYQAMSVLEEYARENNEPQLYELVKLRASYLNGCAYCIDMHSHDALKAGENQQRLLLLPAWREAAHLYTAKEQAALALTDAATKFGEHGVPDDVWDDAMKEFTEVELANLITAIATINAWNRIGVTARLRFPTRTS